MKFDKSSQYNFMLQVPYELISTSHIQIYSYLSNKRRVANNRRVWKKYLNQINKGWELTKGLEFL